jgi:hypothetical protein
MAAKLRPRVSLPDSCRARPPARLKPAAVSFSGLLGGGLRYEAARSSYVGTFVEGCASRGRCSKRRTMMLFA